MSSDLAGLFPVCVLTSTTDVDFLVSHGDVQGFNTLAMLVSNPDSPNTPSSSTYSTTMRTPFVPGSGRGSYGSSLLSGSSGSGQSDTRCLVINH